MAAMLVTKTPKSPSPPPARPEGWGLPAEAGSWWEPAATIGSSGTPTRELGLHGLWNLSLRLHVNVMYSGPER
jgi:hypothetical protein